MSALRGKPGHPVLDQRPGVVRTGPGFGMELQRARAKLGEREPLDGSVVERDVRDRGRLARVDAEAVVLCSHEHAAARALEHGMVRAAMAERQLRRREAGRASEELMAEADAEDRYAADELLDGRRLGPERLWIAWAVREQDAVVAGELVRVDVVRVDGDRRAGACESPEDAALAAVVDDSDPGPTRIAVDVRLLRRDVSREGAAAHRLEVPRQRDRLVDRGIAGADDAAQRASVAQLQHEAARVDAGERDDPLLEQPVGPARAARLA